MAGTTEAASINPEDLEKVTQAIAAGNSVIVLGEVGSGTAELAQSTYDLLSGELDCAIATYKGSVKQFLKTIADQLGIPTEDVETGKPLAIDGLKEEISNNIGDRTLLILPEAKRLTTSIRYWLEDAIANGVRVLTTAVVNPNRDVFLDMIEVELRLPGDDVIRSEMEAEAKRLNIHVTRSRLAELQPLAGKNRTIARKVIRNEQLGLNQDPKAEHSQYMDITPLILAALCCIGVLKFVGLATGDRTLYVIGGIAIMSGLALRYIGSVGSRKVRRRGE